MATSVYFLIFIILVYYIFAYYILVCYIQYCIFVSCGHGKTLAVMRIILLGLDVVQNQ